MKTTIRKTFSKMTARTAAILPAFLVAFSLSAAQPDGFNDGIDRTDPNFVTASGELGMATTKDFLEVQLEGNRTLIGFGQTGDNP